MATACSIYTLSDPATGEIRYVGQTFRSLRQRLYDHVFNAPRKRRTYRDHWIVRLISRGARPVIQLIQEVPGVDADAAEVYWIAYFREQGCPLTNLTDGGGGSRGSKRDAVSRQTSSGALKNAWAKRKASPTYTKPQPTEASIQALCAAGQKRKGQSASPEVRDKMRAAWERRRQQGPKKRKPPSEATKEKLRQAALKQFESPEAREAVGRRHRGKTISPNHRAIVSAATAKRWTEYRTTKASRDQ